jgi:hypothetical protein
MLNVGWMTVLVLETVVAPVPVVVVVLDLVVSAGRASSPIFRCELEARFLEVLSDGGHRLPDEAQKLIGEPACIADSFYEPNSCVF